ncbi:MAG: hypothetical protein R3246_12925, partial [Acidimicrobiia bacterium]|nr:hypothetical protein [Acidimicrobiia bacterium]
GPGSLVSMAVTFMALVNSERALAAGHRHAPCHDRTPELASAPYPSVIVSRAVSDGVGLDIELLPGPSAGEPVTLEFSRLAPGTRYRPVLDGVAGDEVTAGTDGGLQLLHPSAERTRLQLIPA